MHTMHGPSLALYKPLYIYSIHIFIYLDKTMTHMTHKRAFSESRITSTSSPTVNPQSDTHDPQ
jgi:hypothetical protein